MNRPIIPGPIAMQIDPEDGIPRDRLKREPALLVRAPEVMRVVLARVRVVDVGKPGLATLAVVLQDGEEAGHAVPRAPAPAHPLAHRLGPVVPVVVLVEELPGRVPHELRGADVVLVRVDHAAHEPLRARQHAVDGRVVARQARRRRGPVRCPCESAVFEDRRGREGALAGLEELGDLGRTQEVLDVDQERVEGDELRRIVMWPALIFGVRRRRFVVGLRAKGRREVWRDDGRYKPP